MYVPAAGDPLLVVAPAPPPLVAPVSMNRLAVDDADDGAFEVLGLAPADAPGLVPALGPLVGRSAGCTQPVTVMSLLCWMRPAEIVDCAATPLLNATTMAAAPIQMCRVFIRVSPFEEGRSSRVQDTGLTY